MRQRLISRKKWDRKNEAHANHMVGVISYHLGDYNKAKEYLENAFGIKIQTGDKKGEANSLGNVASVFISLGQYDEAKEYLEKALAIIIQMVTKREKPALTKT